jgi:hypothetical protein
MSLDFLLKNMCKTCVYLHMKIETFSKYMPKIYEFLNLEHASMYMKIFPSILMLNTQKITCLAYNCNK